MKPTSIIVVTSLDRKRGAPVHMAPADEALNCRTVCQSHRSDACNGDAETYGEPCQQVAMRGPPRPRATGSEPCILWSMGRTVCPNGVPFTPQRRRPLSGRCSSVEVVGYNDRVRRQRRPPQPSKRAVGPQRRFIGVICLNGANRSAPHALLPLPGPPLRLLVPFLLPAARLLPGEPLLEVFAGGGDAAAAGDGETGEAAVGRAGKALTVSVEGRGLGLGLRGGPPGEGTGFDGADARAPADNVGGTGIPPVSAA